MIRREITTQDREQKWLLISQVEHAHVSGVLAAEWKPTDFFPPRTRDAEPVPRSDVHEILAAITHHDDGWADWERSPAIDPASGRPYSFMNELPIEESLQIWDGSIAAARQLGPLAGWMVAGHFSELLAKGDHAAEAKPSHWQKTQARQRKAWLGEWQRLGAEHTPQLANRALRLLQSCDFLSLWLCCDCPVIDGQVLDSVKPFRIAWPKEQIGPYDFTAERAANGTEWRLTGNPWPFASSRLEVEAKARIAPLRSYQSSEELLSSSQAVRLKWQISR